MHVIRERHHDGARRKASYMYGLDTDLLLLGALCWPCQDLKVLRPMDGPSSVDDHNDYYVVDVSMFREVIHGLVRGPDVTQSVLDYTVLCSLLGNDFTPGLACLPVSRDSMESLLDIYHRTITASSAHTDKGRALVSGASVDYEILRQVLEGVSITEDVRMRDVDKTYYEQASKERRRKQYQPMSSPCHYPMDRYPLLYPFPNVIRPGEAGWRPRYYHHLFIEGGTEATHDACLEYLNGVQWSLDYHCQRDVDGTWHCSYHYAPTALDLANNLMVQQSNTHCDDGTTDTKVKAKHGLNEDMQLLLVLPPRSMAKHVDARLSDIATSVRRGCVQFYPRDFRMLTYLKRYTSECVPVLPVLDHRRILHEYLTCRRKPMSMRGRLHS